MYPRPDVHSGNRYFVVCYPSINSVAPIYKVFYLQKRKAVHRSQGIVIPWESMHGHLVTNYSFIL